MLKAVNGWTPALIVAASVIAVVGAVWLLFEHWFPLSAAPPPPSKLVRVAATPQPPALVYFENPDYPYDVGYPTGWRPVTGDPESVMFEGAAGREIRVAAAAVPQVEPAMTLPVYADRQVEALRRQTPTLIELQRSRVVLPNAQAGVEVDVTWNDASGTRRALLLYVLDSNVAFQLRADAPAAAFSGERRLLDASLRSFALTPPD